MVVLVGVGQHQLVTRIILVSHLEGGDEQVASSKEQGERAPRDMVSRRSSSDTCEVVVIGAVRRNYGEA